MLSERVAVNCERCAFDRPRFEIMDRQTGNIWMMCDVCMVEFSLQLSNEIHDDHVLKDKLDEKRRQRRKGD